jgi:DNA-binding response OmpR family regulator
MPDDRRRRARILIVEDEPMIAMNLEDLLVEQGFEIAGVVRKLEKALALIESAACDAAIIDANLAGVSASPAASAMAARGLPFMIMSGYSHEQLRAKFPGALFIQKPCRPKQIIQALSELLLNAKIIGNPVAE